MCMNALTDFCENSPAITRLDLQVGAWPIELGLECDSFVRLQNILDQIRELAEGSIQAGSPLLFRRTAKASPASWARILLGK